MTGWSNQSVSLIVLDEATSGYSGIFGYSPEPGPGNLIFSVAAAAGTDPYGNPYPAGISTTAGGSTIRGADYIIDNAGAFWYSGTPASGNLIVALANAAGADAFGNAYSEGITVARGAIAGGQINPGTVGTSQIANNAITTTLIAAGAITTTLIASGAVSAAQIAAAAGILGTQLATGTITNTELAGSVTARSLGGITTTISGTAPASPAAGDIWIDSAAGFQLRQYNGTAFVPITWTATNVISAGTITASLIAAGTITATQIAAGTITAGQIAAGTIIGSNITAGTLTAGLLAAGIIVAGIVNGTTITGATIVADGTSGEFLAYSGTPASGNLILSVSPAAGTDAHGNSYKAGMATYGPGPYVNIVGNEVAIGASAADVFPLSLSGGGGAALLSSGKSSGPDVAMGAIMQSKLLTVGGTNPQLCLAAGTPVPVTEGLLEVQGELDTSSLVAGSAAVGAQAQIFQSGANLEVKFPLNTATAYSQMPLMLALESTGAGGKFGELFISSPRRTAHADTMALGLSSSDSSSSANLIASYTDTGGTPHGYLAIDQTGALVIGTIAGVVPGTTPATQDSWNNLGTPAGWTVTVARYIAAGIADAVWMDVQMTAPAGGATTASFPNTLPAAYRPAANRNYPLAITSSTGGNPRLFVGQNGAVSVNGLPSGFTGTVGVSVLVATN